MLGFLSKLKFPCIDTLCEAKEQRSQILALVLFLISEVTWAPLAFLSLSAEQGGEADDLNILHRVSTPWGVFSL